MTTISNATQIAFNLLPLSNPETSDHAKLNLPDVRIFTNNYDIRATNNHWSDIKALNL